ncbi:MAG: phosphotransferase family protein [Acidimicrobiales bacterium]
MAYQLDESTVGAYLASHGVVEGVPTHVERLVGGVSADVVMVEAAGRRLVVKQELATLRVRDEWTSNPERVGAEARGLTLARDLHLPGALAVVAVVAEDYLLVMECAPEGFVPWKAELLEARVDVGVATEVGRWLGELHAATFDDDQRRVEFADQSAFVELRVDPFYRTVAARNPDLAVSVNAAADSLLVPGRCVVHGDYSPKNLLVRGRDLAVIDWEIVHFGQPVFDVAFVVSHLTCKYFRGRGGNDEYLDAARAVLSAYRLAAPEVARVVDDADLVTQVACLVLARVQGKSPVDYLVGEARHRCRGWARRVLAAPPGDLDAAWAPAP